MPESKVDPAETEMRMAQDLLFFAYRDFTNAADVALAELGLGRAHHRALHFIGRNPGITVSDLLGILRIPDQRDIAKHVRAEMFRAIGDLHAREVFARVLAHDLAIRINQDLRHQRALFQRQQERLRPAYREAGAAAVDGFRRVMRGIMDDTARAYIDARHARGD